MSPTNQFRKSIALLFLFFSISFLAQTKTDSIKQKSYDEIYDLIFKAKDSTEKFFYADIYLLKAKESKIKSNLLMAYNIKSFVHNDESKLRYADSIIMLTKLNEDKHYPGYAYLLKGNYYYVRRAYKKALDNHLLASQHAYKYDNQKLMFESNFGVGNIKRYIGKFDEALEIYKRNLQYAEVNKSSLSTWGYLQAISSVASIYNEKKNIDSANYYNRYGFNEASRLKGEYHLAHFGMHQGVTHYLKKEYLTAIDSLENHIPYFEKNRNMSSFHEEELSFIYYYFGESYLGINRPRTAMGYFKKVDTIFKKTRFFYPTLKDTYRRLVDYYKEEKDYQNQLLYLNQLIRVDSILNSNELYLNREVIKEYELPKLKIEKKNILNKLETQKKRYNVAVFSLIAFIILLIVGFTFQYRKQKRYRKRFDNIMNKKEVSLKTAESKKTVKEIKKMNVPEETVVTILQKLESFEQHQEFISNTITLNSLAKKLQTNPNYLSKVVNYHKQVSFSSYLNNLRIEYAINQLQTNPTYRKYTIKAIASEVGFNNVQSFAKAFYNSKGINPSYFMKKLEKMNI